MEYTNEQIKRAVEALPIEFQEAIADSVVSNKVLDIGKRHALHLDQTGKLQDDAMLALLGLIPGSIFSTTLAKDLGIPEAQAEAIVHDINQEVFSPIRKTIQEKTTEEEPVGEEKTPDEELDREEVLHGIENPEPLVGVSSKEVEVRSKEIGAGDQGGGIVEQKLAGAFKSERVETVEKDKTLASIKKIDPYREPMG